VSETIKEMKTDRLNEVLGRLIDFSVKYTIKGHSDLSCPVLKGVATKNLEILSTAPCSCKSQKLFWQLGHYTARIAYQILYNKDMLPHTVGAILAYLRESKKLNQFDTGYLIPITEAITLLEMIQQGIDQI